MLCRRQVDDDGFNNDSERAGKVGKQINEPIGKAGFARVSWRNWISCYFLLILRGKMKAEVLSPSETMVTKTRDKLIEVARQLFAHKGIENTTMNDIANASDKGRRTIYTYFKNKREIYNAVIEKEADQLVARLRKVVESDLPPAEKLRAYLDTRFDIVNDAVSRNESSFKSYLTLDFRRVDRIRRLAIDKETKLFNNLLEEGIAAGVFDPQQAAVAPTIETVVFQGVDYSHLRNNFADLGTDREEQRRRVVGFLVRTIVK